jgi:glycosyltransferase involved in cell wall biosynthesis
MKKTRVLFTGHDLKFLTHVINHFKLKTDYDIVVHTYSGHEFTETEKLTAELPDYDIIFCEWGLGNLKWFSHNKYPGQKLVTRIHLQEFVTPYLKETNWENVDKIIVVGPFMKEKFDRLFPDYHEKCIVIPNLIDTALFNLGKEEGSIFNLGMLGILPRRKSPHTGLEILQELRKSDERYKLHIKSKRPEELDWLWKRPEEQEYYNAFYNSIDQLGLKDAVIFDPHGSDVQEWFRKIGFILSVSEFESFHMAIAEGMASGAIPVIRNWDGVKALFPDSLIFEEIPRAVDFIINHSNPGKFDEEAAALKKYCKKHFSLEILLPQYEKILSRDIDRAKMRKILKKTLVQQNEILQHQKILEDENLRLKKDLNLFREINEKLRAELTKSQEDIGKSLLEIRELNEKLAASQEKSDKSMLEIKKLTGDLSMLRESNQSLAHELKNLKAEAQEVRRRFLEMENSLSWKLGSALVRKPAGFLKGMGKKKKRPE